MSETLIWLPVYNEAKHLREALDSILAQTYRDWTLIISDNRSTDDSWGIIKEYMVKDERISYRMTPVHMAGIAHMKHMWDNLIGFQSYTIHIGGHDAWDPQHLETLVACMKRTPELSIAYSDTWNINENGDVVGQYKDAITVGQIPTLMIPQFMISSVNSPQLFGLWSERVRLATPFRYCCSGWDHLIVMEAALHGPVLFEGGTRLLMRSPKPGADLADYGNRHLDAETLAAGPEDFKRQLTWCLHCVNIALEGIPDDARPLYRMFLTASMFATYMALRGHNLNIVPGAMDAFNTLPEVRQIFSGLNHATQNIYKLLAGVEP